MSFDALRRSRVPIGGAGRGCSRRVGRRVHVPVRVAHREAEGVADRRGAVDLVVPARAPGGSRDPPRRRSSSLRAAARSSRGRRPLPSPRRHVHDGEPAVQAARVPRLEEEAVVAVDDQHVLVAAQGSCRSSPDSRPRSSWAGSSPRRESGSRRAGPAPRRRSRPRSRRSSARAAASRARRRTACRRSAGRAGVSAEVGMQAASPRRSTR